MVSVLGCLKDKRRTGPRARMFRRTVEIQSLAGSASESMDDFDRRRDPIDGLLQGNTGPKLAASCNLCDSDNDRPRVLVRGSQRNADECATGPRKGHEVQQSQAIPEMDFDVITPGPELAVRRFFEENRERGG